MITISDKRTLRNSTFKEMPIGGTFTTFGYASAIMLKTFVNHKEMAVVLASGACIDLPSGTPITKCSCNLIITE